MDNTIQKQLSNLNENTFNSALLSAKDGFYITTGYLGQIVSDYSMTVDFVAQSTSSTKNIASANLPFFIARNPCEILWVAESHIVKGTDGGSVTLDIEKLTGTQAPSEGVSILDSTFDMKGDVNTVVQKEGKDLSTSRQLTIGNRLCIKFAGTKTSLTGVQVTLYLKNLSRGHYK